MNTSFHFNEKYLSQIPALQLLMKLGYKYLSQEQALAQRQGKTSNTLLEEILREQLKDLNRIKHKGKEYYFSEENIQSAIQKLKNIKYDGLLRTNETGYDLLTLGTALEQTIEGDSKSFNFNYINWKEWDKNVFHVTAEFSVERSRSHETARPDIILFVNGIPLAVIECKSPKIEVEQAISQSIRNQSDDYIPKLFTYVQLVMAANKNEAMYATTGTPRKYWSVWKELDDKEQTLNTIIQQQLSTEDKNILFTGEFAMSRTFFDDLETQGDRIVTTQDMTIYSLCSPKRLLDIAFGFTLFESGIKKIARYQQYFVVKSTIERVNQFTNDGKRTGGIIWHTQGSGKSLTMVMLARALAFSAAIPNPRIILVTDRDDLDKQLGNTFAACNMEPKRATSGRNLMELVTESKSSIITTLIHKFDKALNSKKHQDTSPDIFMLIDESHRTNFGSFAARMREMFPNACYLGFTGTPLIKDFKKNNFMKFGGLIEPHYSIHQAVDDKAVVPLLYEGRHVEMVQNQVAIDLWFDRHTQGLTQEQQADLKKKYARAEMLNKTDQVVYMRAFDINEHYRANWQGTGFKAQLVAPNKQTALKYHEYLKELGQVTSEVIISPPDNREGYEEVDTESTDEVVSFWQRMMKRYGNEDEYTKQIINQFKNGEEPEILIVVSKLLTGFDAPRNTVLYLCTMMRDHTLLQAIARVNRLYEGKDFGYIIDYASVLGELDKALTMYSIFEEYDEQDLAGTLLSVQSEISKLPQVHSDLWDIFKSVKNSRDEEAYEVLLTNEELRVKFYECLTQYSKTLAIALSSDQFLRTTDENKIKTYKADLKRFINLRSSVKIRYAETIDYRDYEPRIRKLLDTHIQANEVIQLNEPVNIFDEATFNEVKEDRGLLANKTTAAKADMIAHATKRVITENMELDPAFYEKFSKLIQQAIDEFRAKRLSDLEYLNKVVDIRNKVVSKQHDDVPEGLHGNEESMAYYGVIFPLLQKVKSDVDLVQVASKIAIDMQIIFIVAKYKVQFWDDMDAQKTVINAIDDYLFDEVKDKQGIPLSVEMMDQIIEKVMSIERFRSKRQ